MIPRLTNLLRPLIRELRPLCYTGVHQNAAASSVTFDKEKFKAVLDVQQFQAKNINVEITQTTVTVEGKQEDQVTDQRLLSRHFVKKYMLPKGYYDMNKVESKLSSDGVLTITAPKCDCGDGTEAKKVAILQTGRPFED